MSSVTPFLWFDTQAGEAAKFYLSVFSEAKKISEQTFSGAGPGLDQTVLSVTISLQGLPLTLFNGGPHFQLNEAFSLSVSCADQEEIDFYWNKLTADGGKESRCGWLKDRFGVSWQIVPTNLGELLRHPKAMQVIMQMAKLNIATLEAAAKEE